ncbi:MAG TPA: ABC transporter permease [Phycisphaerae bacterium]|nr:ABC transporter permease [Phycisphaerae bacterium]
MITYLIRRVLYSFPIIMGVLFLLFVLFFLYADPEAMARKALGEKAPEAAVRNWIHAHGYDRPRLVNSGYPAISAGFWTDTLLFDHFASMLTFDFGRSDIDDSPILDRIARGAVPSLTVTVPIFLLGTMVTISIALFVAFFRGTYIDHVGLFVTVLAMSVVIFVYIMVGQYLFSTLWRWYPISGYDRGSPWRFVALPLLIGVIASLGGDVRFYRTIMLEEINRDYVRTARAKGVSELRVMFKHVLRNGMLPILTSLVMQIPFLFMGSLLLENFFGIPGLGAMTFDAIQLNDFATLRVMVFIGALIFVVGQMLTDISYSLIDPRVRLS